jgi:cobyrinic acid a,c-diamide synthase
MTGSGKTTVTLGLLSVLAARGLKVQSFKVGPDFIDTGLHELATGAPSHNLDGWMLSRQANLNIFTTSTIGKDLAIVEGVMGMFDGSEGSSNRGSTAEMATWLELPIILVIDASAMARSAAAIVHGFRTFDHTVRIGGVIFNRGAGEAHFRILSDAVKDIPVLGWLPSNREIEIRERHLGLMTAGEQEARMRVERIRDFFASHIDVSRVLDAMPEVTTPALRATPASKGGEFFVVDSVDVVDAAVAGVSNVQDVEGVSGRTGTSKQDNDNSPPFEGGVARSAGVVTSARRQFRVALARDSAFSFYYHANRNALEQAGAKIVEFSAIHDSELPDADFLYIGGGYPELYRRELEANRSMRDSIRHFIESGGRFYAECGGLMYLAKRIEDSEMVGVFPTEIQLTDRPVDFGYCEITTTKKSIFGPAGMRLLGHQFHYSKCTPASPDPVYTIKQTTREYSEGWVLPNGIASYVHVHFLSNPSVVRNVLES